MLDLDAGVQLEEEEVASVEHELRGAGALIADRTSERDGRVAHARAQVGIERGRRRLLEHLLVASLNRAVALAECEHRAVPVGEQLDLDVSRALEVALEEDGVVTECSGRLAPAASTASSSSADVRTIRMPRPPPPAAAFTRSG